VALGGEDTLGTFGGRRGVKSLLHHWFMYTFVCGTKSLLVSITSGYRQWVGRPNWLFLLSQDNL
jgi:hypothetical protein